MCKSVTAVALLWRGIYYDLHIENIEEIKMSNWTNVKDELPSSDGQYLVKFHKNPFNGKGMAVSEFTESIYPNFDYDRIHLDSVTHWMELPEPPREEK
jgi:hypothetical protein